MEYGPFDLPVARTDGEGHRWQYRYDKDTLQLTEVINPQGESYLYVLDNCGRVTEEHDWGGVVWRYRYDADGLCTARVNGVIGTVMAVLYIQLSPKYNRVAGAPAQAAGNNDLDNELD